MLTRSSIRFACCKRAVVAQSQIGVDLGIFSFDFAVELLHQTAEAVICFAAMAVRVESMVRDVQIHIVALARGCRLTQN